mmetsp:Transcript_18138/g.36590  ORF Transcript_18138/g.36590 Transcript_18138/m.36590 type:complete len:208 (+) Transcript_18138:811-1434(+)
MFATSPGASLSPSPWISSALRSRASDAAPSIAGSPIARSPSPTDAQRRVAIALGERACASGRVSWCIAGSKPDGGADDAASATASEDGGDEEEGFGCHDRRAKLQSVMTIECPRPACPPSLSAARRPTSTSPPLAPLSPLPRPAAAEAKAARSTNARSKAGRMPSTGSARSTARAHTADDASRGARRARRAAVAGSRAGCEGECCWS